MSTTRKPRPLTRDQVERLLRLWQGKLCLDDWTIKLQYGPNADERAGLEAAPEYREATVWWDPAKADVHTMRAGGEWMCHELTHCITWSLEQQAEHWAGDDEAKFHTVREIAETTVTNLERAFLNIDRRGR